MQGMKVGILGGGFDPPHLGHLWMAQQILEKTGLDQVWIVPYNIRNLNKIQNVIHSASLGQEFKMQNSSNLQRLEMTRLAIRGHEKFKVLDMEIKKQGVSYTIDTVSELIKKFPQNEFFFIIGADLVEELPKWKDYEKLIKMVKFLVFPRGEGKVDVWTNLSSTIIRERVKKGLSINRMVRKGVERFIYKNKLYK